MTAAEQLHIAYRELSDLYHSGIEQQDAPKLNAFVRDDRVLAFKDDEFREQYVSLRRYRAECFILFGMFPEAIKECRLALAFANKKQHADIYFLWVKLHQLQFVHTEDTVALKAIAEALIIISRKGREAVVSSKESEYQKLSFTNVEAFFLTYLGRADEAKALYAHCQFTPIDIPVYNDKDALPYLFAHFSLGLATAIELKDETLLRHLLKVISIDDETLYGALSLFKVFHGTLVTTMDTHPAFATAFNQLFQIQDKVKAEMKELNFFLTSTRANMTQALEVAFSGFALE